jgi:hypothetical protein
MFSKTVIFLVCSSVVLANASSYININNKGCNTDASYTTISSIQKIKIESDSYNSSDLYMESGIIKANTDKAINIENIKNKSTVQIIFVDMINNATGKKSTIQLWLTENKLCMLEDKKQCYKIDLTPSKSPDISGIQLCVPNKVKENDDSNITTIGGIASELVK